jgi:DNA-binding CsgD family transcriptional regulator
MAEHVSQEEIYDAFLDDGALAALPGRLAASVGARSCLIQWIVEDGTSAILSQSGYFPDAMLAEYGERWNSIDPWLEASHQWQAPNAAMNLEDLVPVGTFCRSDFYNDFLRRHGDDSCRGIGVRVSNRYGTGLIALQRGRTQEAFGPEAVAALQASATHLRRMLAIRGRLVSNDVKADSLAAMIDAFGQAVMLVSCTGRLLHQNVAAAEIIARSGALAIRDGFLVGTTPRAERMLGSLVARALAPVDAEASAAALPCPDGGRLELTATGVAAGCGKRHAMLIASNCWRRDGSLEQRLRALHNLSPSEATLAVAIAAGDTPAEIAEKRGVALATVRTQIKNIAAKLGCNRQSEIVARVRSLPALR